MKQIAVGLVFCLAAAAAAQVAEDAVRYPGGYASFLQVRTITVKQDPPHGTVFLNPQAASGERSAYPYGSVLVMEWRKEGPTGAIARLDVMRKEKGFGASYGPDRTGEWEYASYSPEGKLITGPAEARACARCHAKAGAAKDFVYAARFPDATGGKEIRRN
jgi:hypothetical protein